ncbi:hypothetical protein EDB92DRAFT_131878 [Lactarius akahatsu]|uniref:BAG domain-containing protein n=1 Tax=Lactarius akahatsu TaxID=416441 RepID=A0AAD4Q9B8_9AGAM|nr:hypothetical protein EDB92DRAFT_131878 [Lactarius akahatsu]
MLGFYPSAAPSYYSPRPVYSDDIIPLQPPTSDYFYLPRTTDPESHYRRALADYLVAEEELFRAREEATLRARVEALQRQEEARLLQARIIRARKERQVQQLERVLAQERAAALAARMGLPEVHLSLPHMVPVACSVQERRGTPNVLAEQIPRTHLTSMEGSQLLHPTPRSPANEGGQPEHRITPHLVPEHGTSVPTSEPLLQARLRKIASVSEDEEARDLARATLHHLAQHTFERDANDTSALSHEMKLDNATQSPEGTGDLSRSDALQGAAAGAAKASFRAHRAAVEQAASPASKTPMSPLETIQDIRATLSKLSANFSIPPSLDFSDDEADGLAYTPTNTPIRAYEHALEGLLARLDAVESDGEEEVRVARRTVVKEVEMALEGVEKKVKRAREVAKDNSKSGEDVLAEATVSSSDLLEDEDTHSRAESVAEAKTEEEEHSASIPAATSYSEVDVAKNTASSANSADVVPDNSAIEDTSPASAEESTEVATALRSLTTVRDEVACVYPGDVPESIYSAIAEQLIPANEPLVSATSEACEGAIPPSPEGFNLTSTPVSPESLPPALPEDVSALRIPSSPDPEWEGEGRDDANNEDEWSEVEA